jgi:hypothetical protein
MYEIFLHIYSWKKKNLPAGKVWKIQQKMYGPLYIMFGRILPTRNNALKGHLRWILLTPLSQVTNPFVRHAQVGFNTLFVEIFKLMWLTPGCGPQNRVFMARATYQILTCDVDRSGVWVVVWITQESLILPFEPQQSLARSVIQNWASDLTVWCEPQQSLAQCESDFHPKVLLTPAKLSQGMNHTGESDCLFL